MPVPIPNLLRKTVSGWATSPFVGPLRAKLERFNRSRWTVWSLHRKTVVPLSFSYFWYALFKYGIKKVNITKKKSTESGFVLQMIRHLCNMVDLAIWPQTPRYSVDFDCTFEMLQYTSIWVYYSVFFYQDVRNCIIFANHTYLESILTTRISVNGWVI